jgi:hypothetical protein
LTARLKSSSSVTTRPRLNIYKTKNSLEIKLSYKSSLGLSLINSINFKIGAKVYSKGLVRYLRSFVAICLYIRAYTDILLIKAIIEYRMFNETLQVH